MTKNIVIFYLGILLSPVVNRLRKLVSLQSLMKSWLCPSYWTNVNVCYRWLGHIRACPTHSASCLFWTTATPISSWLTMEPMASMVPKYGSEGSWRNILHCRRLIHVRLRPGTGQRLSFEYLVGCKNKQPVWNETPSYNTNIFWGWLHWDDIPPPALPASCSSATFQTIVDNFLVEIQMSFRIPD